MIDVVHSNVAYYVPSKRPIGRNLVHAQDDSGGRLVSVCRSRLHPIIHA